MGAGLEQTLAADDSTTSLASLESSGQADKEEGAIPDGESGSPQWLFV